MRKHPAFPSVATGLQWLVLAVLATALLLPQLLVQLASIPHFCLFEQVTGIACPGCGVTGALLQLAGGDPVAAWKSHPGALLFPAYLIFTVMLNHSNATGRRRHEAIRILDYGFLACLSVFWTVSTLIPRLT